MQEKIIFIHISSIDISIPEFNVTSKPRCASEPVATVISQLEIEYPDICFESHDEIHVDFSVLSLFRVPPGYLIEKKIM